MLKCEHLRSGTLDIGRVAAENNYLFIYLFLLLHQFCVIFDLTFYFCYVFSPHL